MCNGEPKQELEQQEAQSSRAPFLRRIIWPYGTVPEPPLPAPVLAARHPPPCRHCLRVWDTPLVSPGGGDLFPILHVSPLITAKMHRATYAEPPTPSCSTAGLSILNAVSVFVINLFHFDKYFTLCMSISLESAVLHERAKSMQISYISECTVLS